MDKIEPRTIGIFLTRVLGGVIFFFQGYGKVFTYGVENVHDMFFLESFEGLLPTWLTLITAYLTSYIELICGFLLIIGFGRKFNLILLSAVLITVSIGHGLIEPIWNLEHVMYRFILIAIVLFSPFEWDRWSVDHCIRNLSNKNQ